MKPEKAMSSFAAIALSLLGLSSAEATTTAHEGDLTRSGVVSTIDTIKEHTDIEMSAIDICDHTDIE
jgi:hypothetical protein